MSLTANSHLYLLAVGPLAAKFVNHYSMFGYDWAKGYVAPYRNSHGEAYTTPHEAIDELLDVIMNSRLLSTCHSNDNNDSSSSLLIDLGSGDGRIPLAAARRGMHAMGIELDEELITSSRALLLNNNSQEVGLIDLCSFCHGSFMEINFFQECIPINADIVCYLLPTALPKLATLLVSVGHQGRIYVLRWSIEHCSQLVLQKCHVLPTNGWTVHEYRCVLEKKKMSH